MPMTFDWPQQQPGFWQSLFGGVQPGIGPSDEAAAMFPVMAPDTGGVMRDIREWWGAPAQGQQQAKAVPTPADRLRERGIAIGDAKTNAKIAQITGAGGNPWGPFGPQQQRRTPSIWEQLVAKQLAGPNTTSGLAGLFNSAEGPYGQLQMAAAMMAPAKADERARRYEADTSRAIARDRNKTVDNLASRLMNLVGGAPMTGLTTDYGMSAELKPVNFRRFFGR